MLSVKNISYHIGNNILLDDVSVEFSSRKLNLIIGPNGAGKSTLIKVICNQLKPQKGEVFYGEKNSNDLSLLDLSKMRAVLSQNIDLAFALNVSEVVMMGRYPHFTGTPTKKDGTACQEAMKFFDVDTMANRNYMTLSGGEKQRVQFARVLAQIWYPIKNQKRYLILDEPLTFLDVYYQFDFMKKVTELIKQDDLIVIGVVHDLNLVAKFADQITLINNGKIVTTGNKHDVLTKENIKNVYHLEPTIIDGENDLYLISF